MRNSENIEGVLGFTGKRLLDDREFERLQSELQTNLSKSTRQVRFFEWGAVLMILIMGLRGGAMEIMLQENSGVDGVERYLRAIAFASLPLLALLPLLDYRRRIAKVGAALFELQQLRDDQGSS